MQPLVSIFTKCLQNFYLHYALWTFLLCRTRFPFVPKHFPQESHLKLLSWDNLCVLRICSVPKDLLHLSHLWVSSCVLGCFLNRSIEENFFWHFSWKQIFSLQFFMWYRKSFSLLNVFSHFWHFIFSVSPQSTSSLCSWALLFQS